MITIDGLKKLGVNTDEGLSRCMGSEQFYIKLVNMIPDEQGFDKLIELFELLLAVGDDGLEFVEGISDFLLLLYCGNRKQFFSQSSGRNRHFYTASVCFIRMVF